MYDVAPFSFGSYFIGLGFGIPVPSGKPVKTDPKSEYVAGGYGFLQKNIPQILPWMVDDVTREYGPEVYDAVNTDSMAGGTFRLLKMQVLSSNVTLRPSHDPGPDRKTEVKEKPETMTSEEVLAQEVCDFCQYCQDCCDTPIKTVFSEMLDAMRTGNKLAEKLAEPAPEDSDYAGKILLKDIKCKPRWTWMFVADVYLTLTGILVFDPQMGGFIIIPRDKVFILSWQPENNDPRGTSLYRTAYTPWNLKRQLYPEYYAHLKQFASPVVSGTTAENADAVQYPAVDKNGNPIPGQSKMTAEQALLMVIETAWANGSAIASPFGTVITPHWPQGSGDTFLKAFDFLNHEIAFGILGSTRDTMEAKHGSKADSETAQDKVTNLIKAAREMVENTYRKDVLHWLVEMNYGRAVADEFTPFVSLGDVEHQDVVALMNGVANLLKAGGIDKVSQMPAIHSMLDLPPSAPGAFERMEAREDAQVEAQTTKAEAVASGNGQPPAPAPSGNGKPKPKEKAVP